MNATSATRVLAVCLLILLGGCSKARKATHKSGPAAPESRQDARESSPASGEEPRGRPAGLNDTFFPPQSRDELVNRFKAAFEAQDAAALQRLIWYEGDNPSRMRDLLGRIQSQFGQKISRIYIGPANKAAADPYTDANGNTYAPALPVIGDLTVEFEPESARRIETETARYRVKSSSFLVGEKNGLIMLTVKSKVH